ncbi:PIN domain-like protein [Mycena indigotica]|uniref:U three protein 23 n=1 Tax=Mycena indigotica TaxID=2126181 RepID=A0A8H6SUZ3_9AGAR|nr:PIN domain-like protein [Mycena indigotica]KAF7306665.1 PIN domain-like protein [Mycena indigotica]
MRQKRAKAYRKLMELYSMSFGFRQPYQVLVDAEFCKTSIEAKTELSKQISSVLQGDVKPMITQCCIHELYLQGKGQQPAVDLAKQFERRKCNHREPIPGDDCLASVVGEANKHRYVVATQSQPLRARLRAIVAVPIVHVNRSVMILEPPSDVTLAAKEKREEHALHATKSEKTALPTPTEPIKKKKGAKGPNPLSVKKKKVEPPSSNVTGQKRRRDEETEEVAAPKKKRRRKAKTTENVEE